MVTDGFVNEIKPAHSIVSVIFMNCGNVPLYLWTDVKLEAGASLPISAELSALLSLSRVNVHFEIESSTSPLPKLVVLAERITPLTNAI